MSILRSLLTSYKPPSVTVAAGPTVLDASRHHARTLVVTVPGTITPPVTFASVGDGFWCDVINLSGGSVMFTTTATVNAGGVVTLGSNTLPNLGTARLAATTANGSSGTIVLTISGPTAQLATIKFAAPADVAALAT